MLDRNRHVISARGLDFIKAWESFVPYVYDDLLPPVRHADGKRRYREWDGGAVRGTLTIGYGHTDAAKAAVDMVQGVQINEAQASAILDVDLDECEAAVNRLAKLPLTQGQFDALVSLTFNMGEGNLRRSSLLAKLNAGDYDGARRAFDLYVNSKGQFMQGLQNRRDGEQVLWDERYAGLELPDDTEETPRAITMPAPPKTMAQSKIGNAQVVAGGGGLVVAGGQAAKELATAPASHERLPEISDQISDFLERGGSIADRVPLEPSLWKTAIGILTDPWVLGAVGVAIVGFAVYTWIERRRKLTRELV